MANSLSSKKRIRQNAKHRARNRWRKGQIKEAVRAFDESLQAGRIDEASERLKQVYKRLDQVAAKGTLHKNSAARKKSRLAKKLHAAK